MGNKEPSKEQNYQSQIQTAELLSRFIVKNDVQSLIYAIEKAKVDKNILNHLGESLLYQALKLGSGNCFKQLYLLGAVLVPKLPYNGTPLHFAVQLQHYEIVKMILRELSVFPNMKNIGDDRGWTPLHVAAHQGDAQMVALLLKYNANPNLIDKNSRTPKMIAQATKHPQSIEIIEQLSVINKSNQSIVNNISTNNNTQVLDSSASLKGKQSAPLRSRSRKEEVNSFSSSITRMSEERPDEQPFGFLQRILSDKNQCVPVVKYNELKFIEQINKGSSCQVWKGRWRQTEVAIKQFKIEYTQNRKEMRKFVKEIGALMRIRHPNLLLLMGVSVDGPNMCILTEFCDNNTLFFALHKNKQLRLSLLDRFYISIQIARGIVYLHKNVPPIVHRDLKPENCLLDSAYNVKIADFGLARPLNMLQNKEIQPEDTAENTTICIGTTRFMAPELFDKDKVFQLGTEIDVWSFGCILIELFSGKRPWGYISSANTNCIYYEKPVPIPEEIEPNLRQLIRSCLNYDQKQRPAMEEILSKLENLYNFYIQQSN